MRNDFVKQSDEKPFFAKSKKKVRKELENIRFTKIYTCKTIDGLCNCSGFIACVNYFKVPIKIGSREAFPCVYSVDVFYIIVESLVFKTMNSLCHLIDLRYTKLGALKHVRDIKSFQRQRRVIIRSGRDNGHMTYDAYLIRCERTFNFDKTIKLGSYSSMFIHFDL